MNWYSRCNLKELTAQNWYDFLEDPNEQAFQKLVERYKKVNAFLKRTEINETVRQTLEELKRRIVGEIRQVQMRMRG